MVPLCSDRIPRVPPYSTLIIYPLTYTRVSLCLLCLSMQFYLYIYDFWALSISLAATLEIDLSFFSSGYLDVSVHRVPSAYLWIQYTVTEVFSAGFPHSEICGSKDICSSPQLFAAYHVFLRLLVPRHPPCALFCLTSALYSVTTSFSLL